MYTIREEGKKSALSVLWLKKKKQQQLRNFLKPKEILRKHIILVFGMCLSRKKDESVRSVTMTPKPLMGVPRRVPEWLTCDT